MSGYFKGRLNDLSLEVASPDTDTGLRECQIGAYWATKAHFTACEQPALITLPTGAGKTALMMLLAFGLEPRRILVVSPSDVLRTQTHEKFGRLDGLVKAGVVDQDYDRPNVWKQTSRVTKSETWAQLEPYDVIVALPHNISTEYNTEGLADIVPPPDGFFDLVFFDEAHHLRAPSWHKLLHDFRGTKCVLLTATPFRRDRRAIPARMAYYYPLDRAMDAGIYHPVRFLPVVVASEEGRDNALCSQAVEILNTLRQDRSVRMLIRTDRIEKAGDLEAQYTQEGIAVEAVHSRRTPRQNATALRRLDRGELDAVIAVGKLGEGLDIANLKIAVFHEPPKSFPFTVQLIGRIARPVDASHEAYVIADPEQLREKGVADEVRRLYHDDPAWSELIPELVQTFVRHVISDVTPGSADMLVGVDFEDLAPYLSARLYRAAEHQINLDADVSLGPEYALYRLPQKGYPSLLGIITETLEKPTWATRSTLEVPVFDLHLYYHHRESQTLFECTTSDAVASQIRSRIMDNECERLGGETLVRLLHSEQDLDYLVAGLANALGPSGALPSYKMFLGSEVQGAVNPSDARVFVRGHVVARTSDGETRGISDGQGRVWAMRRASIHDFVSWCDRIAQLLVENEDVHGAQGLEFLGSATRQKHFPHDPMLIVMNPQTVAYSITLEEAGSPPSRFDSPTFDLAETSGEDGVIVRLDFFPSLDAEAVEVTYDIEHNRWAILGSDSYHVKVDYGRTYDRFELSDFLRRFPPYFYLPNATVIIGGRLWRPRRTYDALPSECLVSGLDWSECDIKVEYAIDSEKRQRRPEAGKMSVHQWLERRLIEERSDGIIVFKDHGSGEAADYIVIDEAQKEIGLYHCKAAPKYFSGDKKGQANIGATLAHVQDALDQVLRSVVWVKRRKLVDQIALRHERENQTHFVRGEELFVDLKSRFGPSEWSYQVHLVNPGLDLREALEARNVNVILLTCYEWLRGVGCELRIMGYEERQEMTDREAESSGR